MRASNPYEAPKSDARIRHRRARLLSPDFLLILGMSALVLAGAILVANEAFFLWPSQNVEGVARLLVVIGCCYMIAAVMWRDHSEKPRDDEP